VRGPQACHPEGRTYWHCLAPITRGPKDLSPLAGLTILFRHIIAEQRVTGETK
jgi:hypothetical protein